MKKLFDQHKWLKIVLGIVIFSLGLVTLIISLNNEGDVLLKIICIIVAIYCFSTALFGILAALITEKRNKYH
ncbi:MAG TPA: hypothetical protein PLR04_03985, partial [Bacilli bacterium]|nr:hypothetical protein [Bacilli bacterium]